MPTQRPQLVPFTARFLNGADVLALPVVDGVVIFEGGSEIKDFLKSVKSAIGGVSLSAKELTGMAASYNLTGKAGELIEIPVTSRSIS